jgi:hypothetical protein
MTLPIIRSIVFDDSGATVEFANPDDVRGDLVMNRVLRIPFGRDYSLEIDAVLAAIESLVVEVVEDFNSWRPKPEQVGDDDEDDDDLDE